VKATITKGAVAFLSETRQSEGRVRAFFSSDPSGASKRSEDLLLSESDHHEWSCSVPGFSFLLCLQEVDDAFPDNLKFLF
jgi:hypothetical protein